MANKQDAASVGAIVGRPSDYSVGLGDAICLLISEGQSLRAVCDQEGMPDKSTVFRWLAKHEEFRDKYARAREAQADEFAEEILDIADDGTNDYTERKNRDGSTVEVVDQEHINRSRLRVDTRKWLMSKMAPKKYGDRVTTELTGPNGGPIQTEDVNDSDRVKAFTAFLAKMGAAK